MARRLGVMTPHRAEYSENVYDHAAESTSAHLRSYSRRRVSFCLLLFALVLVTYFVFGEPNFHALFPEDQRQIRGAEFGAVEEHLSVQQAHEVDENFSNFLAFKDEYGSSRPECRANICEVIPILQEVYGKVLHRTLHVGPGTCGVVSNLLKEDDVEVWGIQPFDMREPIHPLCENFVRKGIIRVSNPYHPFPYTKRSFSLVIVSGTLDQMKPKELNQTLSNLAKVSSHSIMLVVGNGAQLSSKTINDIKRPKPFKSRSRLWWRRRLAIAGLKEDAEHSKRFEILQAEKSLKTSFNIFHLHAPGTGEDN